MSVPVSPSRLMVFGTEKAGGSLNSSGHSSVFPRAGSARANECARTSEAKSDRRQRRICIRRIDRNVHLDYLIPPKLCGSRQVHPHESIASPLTRPLPWRSKVAGRATPTRPRPPYWPSERDVGSVDSGPSPPARDRLAIAILILAGANYLGERIPRSVREWAAESAFATRPIAARSGQQLASTSVPG